MDRALGLIEVIGYPTAIEAADAALKAANITLGGITKVGSGIVTIQLFGDVGAIKASVEAGGTSASRIGKVRATHIIPRVDDSLMNSNVLANKDKAKSPVKEGSIVTKDANSSVQNRNNEYKDINDYSASQDNSSSQDNNASQDNISNQEEKDSSTKAVSDIEYNLQDMENNLKDIEDNLKDINDNLKDIEEVPVETLQDITPVNDNEFNELALEEISKKSVTELKSLIQSHGIPVNSKKLNNAKKDELIKYITEYVNRKKGEV